MNRLVLLVGLLVASSASAETPTEINSLTKPEAGFGLAVNNPMMWRDKESIGVSAYYRFAPRQVIRINGARYELRGSPIDHALGAEHTGRATDLGVGWIYFPRRAFDGPSVELGAVLRDNDTYSRNGRITTDELARVLVGWSVLEYEHLFASVAVGGSVGRANGHEYGDTMTRDISEWTANVEGYVRLGFVFGN